jgi:murein DD-endopeptidase MepM/ murein hydrolase activator NlpD
MQKSDKSIINRWLSGLTNRYRLVVMNEDSFEEAAVFNLSRLNIYLILSSIFVVIVAVVCALVIFTPVKEYLPGYEGVKLKKEVIDMKLTLDSLDRELGYADQYYRGIRFAMTGGRDSSFINESNKAVTLDSVDLDNVSESDLMIRDKVEKEIKYRLFSGETKNELPHFILPIEGMISSSFNEDDGHFGIDIVAAEESIIKSIYNGMVVFSDWTIENGHVLVIQHDNDYLSVYKHNSQLLRKNGNFVQPGDPIAVIGNTGTHSTGTHLHFELWHKGNAVDPEEYINFK